MAEQTYTLSSARDLLKVARLPQTDKLRCPRCFGVAIRRSETGHCCQKCSLEFKTQFSCIPNFLLPELAEERTVEISPETPAPELKNDVEQKIFQRIAHDGLSERKDEYEFDINRPYQNPLFEYLTFQRIYSALKNIDVQGAEVLVVCAGRGMDSELLSRMGAKVTAIDISPNMALSVVDRFAYRNVPGEGITSMVADAENLPLKDRSFDYAVSYEGLHHLPRPIQGISEMCRVVRKSIIFAEPAQSLLLPFARVLGRGRSKEWCGNVVYRFTPKELAKHLNPNEWRCITRKMFKFEKHRPGALICLFGVRLLLPVAKLGVNLFNKVFSLFGTQLIVQVRRVD